MKETCLGKVLQGSGFRARLEHMFEDLFTGNWLYLHGKWGREVCDQHTPDLTESDTAFAGPRLCDADHSPGRCSAADVGHLGDVAEEVSVADSPPGAALAALLAGVADGQVHDAEVLDRIVGFERLGAWAAAGQARALAELVTRRTATDPNELPYAVEEVTLALSCSRIAAGNKVATALDLADRLPGVLAALEQGRICPARARVFTDCTRHLSAEDAAFVEQVLLAEAETLSPARLKVTVSALADSLDPREIEDRHADAAENRRVIKTPQDDGMASIWALLPADQAALVWAAINARAEHGRPTGPGGSAGPDGHRTQPEPTDARTADQRRADALTDLATLYLQGATNLDPVTGDVGQPPKVPGWAQVQVKLSAELLLGTSTEPAHLRGHGPIPTSMAVRIAADAQWQRIVYDPMTGVLLDVGTTRHDPPPALREYVLARDLTCTWANCGQPRVDLDHVIPYPAGPTAEPNLDAKCRHHHRTKQRWNFHTVRHDDGSTTITTPTGHTYTSPASDHRPPPRKPPFPTIIGDQSGDDPPPF